MEIMALFGSSWLDENPLTAFDSNMFATKHTLNDNGNLFNKTNSHKGDLDDTDVLSDIDIDIDIISLLD